MIVPITDRARRWGYLIWPSRADADVRALLGDVREVAVSFRGNEIGSKTVDWKHRRISIGSKQTRELPSSAKQFVLDYVVPILNVTVVDEHK